MNMKNLQTFVCAVATVGFILATASSTVLAGNGNGNSNEQGSSNGQPFQTLAASIEAVRADLQGQIDDVNSDILDLDARISANEGDIDALEGDVDALDNELDALQAQLNALEGVVDGAQCPPNYSIRSIDPLICEFDSTINDRLIVSGNRFGPSVFVPSGQTRSSTKSCLTGYRATGCSFRAGINTAVTRVENTGTSTCLAVGYGRLGNGNIQAVAQCTLAAPSP